MAKVKMIPPREKAPGILRVAAYCYIIDILFTKLLRLSLYHNTYQRLRTTFPEQDSSLVS